MGKSSRKKAVASAEAVVPQCIIGNIDTFSRKCAGALKRALDLSDEVFSQKLERLPSTRIYFFTAPKVEAEIRGDNRPVLALPAQNRWLHVAINLQFVEKGRWRVDHVSVNLLHGELSNAVKKSLLRAEWQIHEKPDDTGHAQPHWHVLGAAGIDDVIPQKFEEVVEAAAASLFEGFLSGQPPEEEDHDQGFAHFHYAMVTDWHVTPSQGPCHTLSDETSLITWLGGCVRYIHHQLDHVARKAGTRVEKSVVT